MKWPFSKPAANEDKRTPLADPTGMTPIKVGVIGVGHLGKEHARIYSSTPGCELVGLVDSDVKTAEIIAKKVGTRVFGSVAELISAVDAVSVVVPTTYHF